jgi:hypothetical protein
MHPRLLWLAFFGSALTLSAADSRDPYGGATDVRGKPTGFFHTEQLDGAWWLITPDGNGFLSKGVNHVQFSGDTSPKLGYSPYRRAVEAKHGSVAKWAEATAGRLRDWRLNTVGAWSSPEMFGQRLPYTALVGVAEAGGANWQRGEVADVFSPKFAEAVRERAQRICAAKTKDPHLLGYFTDNELRWGADWRSKKSLFEDFIAKPADSAGKQAAVRLIRGRYATVDEFNRTFGADLKSLEELPAITSLSATSDAAKPLQKEFLREYARAYFQTAREAILAADPNHLILGCRFAGYAPDEVVEAMGEFVDVVSFNNYSFTAPVEQLRKLHAVTKRPVMLTEFGFKAMDSGLPNTRGAGKPLATQPERADHFERYVTALEELPFMVGYHWFQWSDQPAEGRFDGENSNYGIVKGDDEAWAVLAERMREVNGRIEDTHRKAARQEK